MENYYLLIKYYQNEANSEEKREVENWLSESDENQNLYDQFVLVWRSSEKAKVLDTINTDYEWQKVVRNSRIKHLPMYKQSSFFIHVAAILILFMGVYWLMQDKIMQPKYLLVKNESINSIKTVTLEDGTKISLNYEASLYYPNHFKRKSRNVKLEGNAFFNVAKNKDKPFTIETNLSVVRVLGTTFDVQANKEKTIVTVATGKVRVSDKSNKKAFVELIKSEQVIHDGEKLTKSNVQLDNYLSWKTGTFRFNNHSLIEVMNILERRFHFNYHFEKDDLKSSELTADFNGETLDDIVEIIQLSCQVKINLKSNQLIISEYE